MAHYISLETLPERHPAGHGAFIGSAYWTGTVPLTKGGSLLGSDQPN